MMRSTMDPEEAETRVLHSLADFRGRDVVEVGCGDGRLTWRFAEHAASVLAFDPDPELIRIAREEAPAPLRSKVTFQVADIQEIDLPRGAFDVALLSWSLC